ncbi:MAG: UDP-N-acetylglucosamine 1-carboxyvinyltransferase [Alkaliphilus sp.]|nr:UDP-N-acetylglucosamine 1-carboxyvinyltransferase [bacterium AH-315-L21]MBN4062573.1 UDP-N-acetylglucosamine 1-carboxyvinyltransferase [Alkaliphilus sp. AH-315-G20]MBN4074560.1 UDP-N-acetylglucosamine 1-carboxyvinyltransferase [bacterium AH-315-E09]PHS35373.1 MAG: UDP-N-acetylglucosamine 1-carboxyvinyltransferase [Alkaliphilus sp.]
MSRIIINGGRKLVGTVRISGAKNSVLPILAASLLSTEKCILEDIPKLRDVDVICEVLTCLGADVVSNNRKKTIEVNAAHIDNFESPYELIRKMRASFLVMGPLLARMGEARISMPGGCAIGSRPIDLHLKGFRALGAKVEIGNGFIEAKAKRLKGSKIYLDFPSVGATENIMMAAVLAEGSTVIQNAAEEPEITDLASFLNKMGARIVGAGTGEIRIEGVTKLSGTKHTVIPDRIEAGTYMVVAAITGGNVLVDNVDSNHVRAVIAKLQESNVEVSEEGEGIRIIAKEKIKAVDIKTLPYPGFPTDMQSQFMALMSVSEGTSVINETVFENRFAHVSELKRLGANIKIEGRSVIIKGRKNLMGAHVNATDLRAGAALILAGLASRGKTTISNVEHIDRGYVDIEGKLARLGANIYRSNR